jgi:hypothetical protein
LKASIAVNKMAAIFRSIIMQNRISIYLSGSVIKDKSKEENTALWGEHEITTVSAALAPVEVNFLNPSDRNDDLSDSHSVVGRDLMQVYFSDFIIVDAREKRGVGVGAEMLFAISNDIPIVTIVPRNSHYHKDKLEQFGQTMENWTHPFLDGLSTIVAPSLEEGLELIKSQILPRLSWKADFGTNTILFQKIKYYLDTQLANDMPMQSFFQKDPQLMQRKNEFLEVYERNEHDKSSKVSQLWRPKSTETAAVIKDQKTDNTYQL